jgi:hypothetical protein
MAGSPARACLNMSRNQRSTQSLTTYASSFRSLCDILPLGVLHAAPRLLGGGHEGLFSDCGQRAAAPHLREERKVDEARGGGVFG